jgi:hypothetical protein
LTGEWSEKRRCEASRPSSPSDVTAEGNGGFESQTAWDLAKRSGVVGAKGERAESFEVGAGGEAFGYPSLRDEIEFDRTSLHPIDKIRTTRFHDMFAQSSIHLYLL